MEYTIIIAVITKTINVHNFIKFHAWANSHVNFPYPVTGPLALIGEVVSEKIKL